MSRKPKKDHRQANRLKLKTGGRKRNVKRSGSDFDPEFLAAHEPLRRRKPRKGDMPRALVEREIAEWMLADKEKHTGEDFGARPRSDIPFHIFNTYKGSPIPGDDAPLRRRTEAQERETNHFVALQASRCAELFRAVVIQLALDLEPTWGCTQEDRKWARALFKAETPYFQARTEELCALALIEPEALQSAYRAGRLNDLSREAIGKRRWDTRRANIARNEAENPTPGKQLELAL